jgi:hypothetical protein
VTPSVDARSRSISTVACGLPSCKSLVTSCSSGDVRASSVSFSAAGYNVSMSELCIVN